jgi:tRNA 2-thiouridine synthesizing protein A
MLTLDNRGLEPPQPMMRTLEALEGLQPGESLTIINDRRPMFLFAELDEVGSTYDVEEQLDGSFKVVITK